MAPPNKAIKAEGIAGRAWASNQGGVVVENLPEIGEDPDESLVQDYAERTHVSNRTDNVGACSCWTARIRH